MHASDVMIKFHSYIALLTILAAVATIEPAVVDVIDGVCTGSVPETALAG